MTRGRKPNIEASVPTNLHLPETMRARLDLILFSEVEGRVPKGAYQKFFMERLSEYFTTRTADLSATVGAPAGTHFVRAKPETILALVAILRSQDHEQATPAHT